MTVTNWAFYEEDDPIIDALQSALRSRIFGSESERKAAMFVLANERQRSWQAAGECSFPDCIQRAIPRSHALSRALMIEPLSEAGHVVGLEVDSGSASYRMRRIGINKASTFPGFCEAHEKEFEFEGKGIVSDGRQLQRQLFRSICRHVYFLEHEKQSLIRAIDELRARALPLLDHDLRRAELRSEKGMVHAYLLEELFGNLDLMVAQRTTNVAFDRKHWLEPHAANFGGYPCEFGFHDELIRCPSTSVAVATAMLFANAPRGDDGTPDFSYQYYVNFFPNDGAALIHLTALQQRRDLLVALAELFSDSAKATLTIEGWLRNSEHWYMRPSAWDEIDREIQDRFLEDHASISMRQ